MAVRAACASTGFTTATTWAVVDTSVTSGTAATYLASEAASTALSSTEATNRAASGFAPGAITIDAIGVRIGSRNSSVSGTFSVQLFNLTDTAVVAGTLVTVNASDVPFASATTLDGPWFLFKLSAPVTLTAGKAYVISPVVSSSLVVSLFNDGTSKNWSRFLRTTTTGAPAAGDDLIIAGEWTAAATVTTLTVTMDSTAATDYGSAPTAANGLLTPGIAIGEHGVLTYGTTAATNYLLQLSNSLIVYNGGTLNIGTTGTPIPRDGSAVLQFDLAADGDYGLVARNGSTVNLQGLSRTSGKNVVSAKLNADSSTNLMQGTSNVATALTITAATTTLDPTGISLGTAAFNALFACSDTVANSNHKITWTGVVSVTATTQVYTQWVKRGSGTNNRFVRLQLATATTLPATNGFYADFDLQTPSAGTCTALGNGTATSASITAFGGGFICTIIGKISSGASAPIACIGACNASTVVSYTGDATQNFIVTMPQVYTLSAQPTQDTIDTDTGWLSGDVVALASTTRTAAECEVASLASNAGASTLTYNLYPVNARSGTSPTQAEVILLTRNVKVRSTNSTLMTYVQIKSGAVVDIDWAEFYYLGTSTTGQKGVDVEVNTTAATNFSMQTSSIHDTEVGGFSATVTAAGGTLTALTFSSNTLWNLSTATGPGITTSAAITATGWTMDSNILLRTGSGNGITFSDVGGTFTNNTVVGAASTGISWGESSSALGTTTGNTAHSNTSTGAATATGISGTLGTLTSWRNSGVGFNPFGAIDLILSSPILFGNTLDNISVSGSCDIALTSPIVNGDTTFATTNGIRFTATSVLCAKILISDGDFSTVTGIKTAHTSDINIGIAGIRPEVVLRNTKLGAATEVATPSNLSNNGFIASEKHDGTAGNHMTWMRNGKVQTDTTIFNTLSPSMRMTPTSATLKLESAYQFQGMKVAVASGSTVTIGVYVRKSILADGTAYSGNQPRLVLKANPAIGITTDTVIATAAAAAGSWEQLTGTTASATDDGAMEFVVDCDGTGGGWVNVDDYSAS
jgi:hypothetical protein